MTNQSPSDSQTNRVDTGASAMDRETIGRLRAFAYAQDTIEIAGERMVALCDAALAAQDSGQGEAVAWITPAGLQWLQRTQAGDFRHTDVASSERDPGWTVPLFAHPPKPAQVGEKWRPVTMKDAEEIEHLRMVEIQKIRGYGSAGIDEAFDMGLFYALQSIGAVVPAREEEPWRAVGWVNPGDEVFNIAVTMTWNGQSVTGLVNESYILQRARELSANPVRSAE